MEIILKGFQVWVELLIASRCLTMLPRRTSGVGHCYGPNIQSFLRLLLRNDFLTLRKARTLKWCGWIFRVGDKWLKLKWTQTGDLMSYRKSRRSREKFNIKGKSCFISFFSINNSILTYHYARSALVFGSHTKRSDPRIQSECNAIQFRCRDPTPSSCLSRLNFQAHQAPNP